MPLKSLISEPGTRRFGAFGQVEATKEARELVPYFVGEGVGSVKTA